MRAYPVLRLMRALADPELHAVLWLWAFIVIAIALLVECAIGAMLDVLAPRLIVATYVTLGLLWAVSLGARHNMASLRDGGDER